MLFDELLLKDGHAGDGDLEGGVVWRGLLPRDEALCELEPEREPAVGLAHGHAVSLEHVGDLLVPELCVLCAGVAVDGPREQRELLVGLALFCGWRRLGGRVAECGPRLVVEGLVGDVLARELLGESVCDGEELVADRDHCREEVGLRGDKARECVADALFAHLLGGGLGALERGLELVRVLARLGRLRDCLFCVVDCLLGLEDLLHCEGECCQMLSRCHGCSMETVVDFCHLRRNGLGHAAVVAQEHLQLGAGGIQQPHKALHNTRECLGLDPALFYLFIYFLFKQRAREKDQENRSIMKKIAIFRDHSDTRGCHLFRI
eukprot:comp10320_c0_seq1/m.12446 comp10320_c0_seq1/g.12446  ORF comp10320_c0_seq1/g.12446 comp10320_c0_seq1/m.12446 type:complete len:320 (+) comp10320_c0_seq1:295-1254(+)